MNAGQRDNGLLDAKLRSTVLMEDGGTHVSILASLTETTHLMILRQLVVNLYTAANKAVLRENKPLDPDVCHISPKMLWIHYLVGVSHFAKFCKIPAVTVWEILINLLKSPRGLFLNCKENGEVIQKPNLGLQHPPKGNQVFRLVGPIVTQVSMKSAHNFFSNAAHGMTRAERTIT